MYAIGDWGNAKSGAATYKPWSLAPTTQTQISGTDWTGKLKTATIKPTPYNEAISYGSGWFQKDLLQIAKPTQGQQVPPITQHRYNPTIDTGHGNKIWIRSILNTSLGPPTTDTSLILEEPTFQETQKTSLQELINQQQQQQQSIKHNLLKLISHLKKKQSVLQLQTGLLD